MLMTSAKTRTTSDLISPVPEGKPSSLPESLLIPCCSWKSRGALLSLTHFRHLTAHFTLMGGFSFSSQCFIISSRTIYSKVRIHLESPIFRLSWACQDPLGKLHCTAVRLLVKRRIFVEITVEILSQGICGMSHQLCSL